MGANVIYKDWGDAEREADEATGDTGITHLVVERFLQPQDPTTIAGVVPADDERELGTLYVLTHEELSAKGWDEGTYEVQYDATRGGE